MRQRSSLLALPLCLFLAIASQPRSASSQWTRLTKPNLTSYFTPHFLNPNVGYAFAANDWRASERISVSPQGAGVFKTVNGGTTWTEVPYFRAVLVTQLSFVSLNEGYASTLSAPIGIAQTTDGGSTWKRLPCPAPQCFSVYATPRAIAAISVVSYNPKDLLITHDRGKTWDTVKVKPTLARSGLNYTYVCGNLDHNIYAIGADGYDNIFLVYSSDDGHSWSYSELDPMYTGPSVQIFGVPHSSQVIRQHLDSYDRINDTYSFFTAFVPYSTWTQSLQRHETGGWITGTPCAHYLPNATTPIGLYRSTDRGKTWKSVGGSNSTEIDDGDWQTVSVVGYGAVVYCVGAYDGDFRRTSTGGDNTLSAAALAPKPICTLAGDVPLNVSQCDSSRFVITIANPTCSIARLKDVSIPGLADSLWYYTYHDHLSEEGMLDSIVVTLAPTWDLTQRQVLVSLIDDEFVTYDTVLPVTFTLGATNSIALATNTPVLPLISGHDVDLPLYARPIGSPISASTLCATFTLRHDLFTPLSFTPTWRGVLKDTEIFGGDTAHIELTLDPAVLLGASSQLGYLRCQTRLTDSNVATITMGNVSAISGDGNCLGAFGEDTTIAASEMDCAGRTLQRYLRGESLMIDLEALRVDRATHLLSLRVNERHRSSYNGTVYTITGERVAEFTWSGAATSVDASGLTSGLYILSIERQGSAAAVNRSFVIER